MVQIRLEWHLFISYRKCFILQFLEQLAEHFIIV